MAKLQYYATLAEKAASFSQAPDAVQYFTIDHAYQFKNWYDEMTALIKHQPLGNFFRGSGEARYQLYNSAQRFWMQNNLTQLEAISQPLS